MASYSHLRKLAAIERDIQRIDRFRALIIQGFHQPEPGGFICRDHRNIHQFVTFEQLDHEISDLETIANRLLAV